MKYILEHKREVRGERIHETTEERLSKQKSEEYAVELLVRSVKTEFLVPTVEDFFETALDMKSEGCKLILTSVKTGCANQNWCRTKPRLLAKNFSDPNLELWHCEGCRHKEELFRVENGKD